MTKKRQTPGTNNRLPYINTFWDSRGKLRHTFRRAGYPRATLPGEPGSPEFMDAYWTAMDGEKIKTVKVERGSLAYVLADYYRSHGWLRLKPSTKKSYRSTLERLNAEHGHKPIARMQRRHVREIMQKMADRPAAANNHLKYLKILLDHAIEMELRQTNPAAGVKPFPAGDGFRTWTERDISQFCKRHAVGTAPRLALELLLSTGQRIGDAILMGWHDFEDGFIQVKQSKTGAELSIPVHPNLAEELASVPRDRPAFLVTGRGEPFANSASFGNWFRKHVRDAGLSDCPAHGLRKAAARRLGEAGCTDRQIMSITGHTSHAEVSRYTKAMDQKRLAAQAMAQLTNQIEDG